MKRTSTCVLVSLCLATWFTTAAKSLAQEPSRAEVLDWFAQADRHYAASEFSQAVLLYEKVLKEAPRLWGEGSKNHATVINNLANQYSGMGKYDKAEEFHLRALKMREDNLGRDDPETAMSLANLANVYRATGQFAKAEALYVRSLQIREAKLGPDSLDVADSLNNLAVLYKGMSQYAKAEPLYQRSLKIKEARLGSDHVSVATTLNNLALIYDDLGQYAKAEPLYQRSLQIHEARQGPDHPDTALALNNLAILYQQMGQFAKAEPLYQRSLKIKEARLGPDHLDTAATLNNLATLYRSTNQFAKAEPLYQRCLKIKEAKLGPDHADLGSTLQNLANLYKAMSQYEKAEPLYQRSLKIMETKLGPDHPDTAHSFNNLAALYDDLGQYAKARELYQHALKIREAKFGPNHPDVAGSFQNLANMAARQDQIAEAAADYDRVRHIVRYHGANVLPLLSDAEQRTFFRNTDQGQLHVSLTLGFQHPSEANLAALSAGWLLNAKGVAHETLAQANLTARDSLDPEIGKTVQALSDVRGELARLTLSAPRPGQEQTHQARRQELTSREQELARQLQQAGSAVQTGDPWVELASLREALPAKSVFVDFARFDIANFKAKANDMRAQPARYVAWVTGKEGPVRIVDLGEAEPIDAAVRQARQAIEETPKKLKAAGGEIEAEKATRSVLTALADKILKPLRAQIDSAETWILCPDGNLWLAPWSALPLDDKTYAIEKHTIRLVVSGRNLVKRPGGRQRELSAPTVFADPDFDRGAEGTAPSPEGSRSLSSDMRRGRALRLPETAAEAEAVADRLGSLFGAEPRMLLEGNATTGAFAKLQRPRALILATHGFFLPEQPLEPAERERLDRDPNYKPVGRVEDPLLRCGLLLAGSNRPDSDKDTGVLTGREILSTDLRGTKLVVLSACETGLGDVHNGEGVAGLRQAFQLAGAESVLASLWKVPDVETALLMAGYFDAMSRGQDRAEALRQTQMQRMKERRDKFGAAHPYFWAAFSLTGEAAPLKEKR